MATLRVGSLAYFDTFAGLVPCKVESIVGKSGPCGSDQTVRFRLTAKRGSYRRGEFLEAWGLHVVPRDAIRKGRITPYQVEVP